jgi:cell division protein FtsB
MWRERSGSLSETLLRWARACVPPRLERRYRDSLGFRRRVHTALRWSFVPILAYAFVFTDSGLASILLRIVRIQALRSRVAELERRQEWLQQEIALREDDRTTLERLARERCGMAYPGEKVYRIVEISPAEARRVEREKHRIEKQREAEADAGGDATDRSLERTARR